MRDSTEIFSDRVQNYLAYRPSYSPVILDVLRAECLFNGESVIADIGSGTGLLSELFLNNGNFVFGIEPNLEMRNACENRLKAFSRFVSLAGRAEGTTLEDDSVDFVIAGQAFHWFNLEQTKQEFMRILKPKGWVIVVYNVARTDTPFQLACQQFRVTYLEEKGSETEETDIYSPFFGKGNFTEKRLEGVRQKFDMTGFAGRVLSSANAPEETTHRYTQMMDAIGTIFEQYQQDEKVEISYATEVVFGRLSKQ